MKYSKMLSAFKFVSVMMLADLLGISQGLCYRLIHEGQIPAVRLGRRLVIPVAVLEAMLTASREGGDVPWREKPGELQTATEPSFHAKMEDGEPPSG